MLRVMAVSVLLAQVWLFASLEARSDCPSNGKVEGEEFEDAGLLQLSRMNLSESTHLGLGLTRITPTCALCAAAAAGLGMVACLGECALTKSACIETCQQTIASITAAGGFCATAGCHTKVCSKNEDCDPSSQYCCGLFEAKYSGCFPSVCNPKRDNHEFCNEDAMCNSGHCNAIWDSGEPSTCDEKRNCDNNDECDQEVAFCCGVGDTVSSSCALRTCSPKKKNRESCGENAQCFSGYCCALWDGCEEGWGHCKDLDSDCKVSEWGPWSVCSASCNGGTQTRKRLILVPKQKEGKACPELEVTQQCNIELCPTTPTTTTLPVPPETTSTPCERARQCKADKDCCPEETCIGSSADEEGVCCEGEPDVEWAALGGNGTGLLQVGVPDFFVTVNIPENLEHGAPRRVVQCAGVVSGKYVLTAGHCWRDWCVSPAEECKSWFTIDEPLTRYKPSIDFDDRKVVVERVTINPFHDVAVASLNDTLPIGNFCLSYTTTPVLCTHGTVFPANALGRPVQMNYVENSQPRQRPDYWNTDTFAVFQEPRNPPLIIKEDAGGPVFKSPAAQQIFAMVLGPNPTNPQRVDTLNLGQLKVGATPTSASYLWWLRYVKTYFSTCGR
eukprot:TRINITY_DN19202_c0_g1_i1.p1 TRINITY_DN19202_c0_g1~~TRINITY_DN19202_c0_g1_i1.p1  ORF type:complete len:615 (-),score=79.90 TRINITY_DN19202_c0_g1_i1:301-2145(-)